MTASVVGIHSWAGSRNENGDREYRISHKVRAAVTDGPATIMDASGLPAIGAIWSFLGESDANMWCRPLRTVQPYQQKEGHPFTIWLVESSFGTWGLQSQRCQNEQITDPLQEPTKISGGFVKYSEEATQDMDGTEMVSSSWERLTGPNLQFDCNRPTVRIEQNVLDLGLATFAGMIDRVNGSGMWGLPKRCIKLSNASWERRVKGTCGFYFTRVFEFEIRYDTFDRVITDVGTRALRGHFEDGSWVLDGSPSADNPGDFVAVQDEQGRTLGKILLDGSGQPATSAASVATRTMKKYKEADFFSLGGIPVDFSAP